ncbi:MAG: IPT/TIG domain-containing protein [Deltaproteobacteria bacterium]|nr:IPT/TIG domain-containing protein [Deltaproteobacteria bacterium]
MIREETSICTSIARLLLILALIAMTTGYGCGGGGGGDKQACTDNDNDSYYQQDDCETLPDCNDDDDSIYPGAEEICGDGIDQDCDGSDLDCNDADNDGDGYTENQGDCNDDDPTIYSGAEEICGDGIDQDCDGSDEICIPDPVADAGPDLMGITTQDMNSLKTGEMVYLNASGSMGGEWTWNVVNQSVAGNYNLTSTNTQVTAFYADTAGEYTIQLQVGNGEGETATDEIIVKLIDDVDMDGIPDDQDLDVDGDCFLNTEDIFPNDKASHYDNNADGTGNYYENDVDGDGADDIHDDFPMDSSETAYDIYVEANEIASDNQNDGISVSEDAGSAPKTITGYIYSSGGKTDIDYYKIHFQDTGHFSVMLTGDNASMMPSIAVMDGDGVRVNATTANFPLENGSTAISMLISDISRSYYLSITDSSGASDDSWAYSVKIFTDTDLDGVPTELEEALDSNHLNPDSDGDGIPDYVEISKAIDDWSGYADSDGDGLPCWWDLDSDGDGIADALEYFTKEKHPDLSAAERANFSDVDEDGTLNFLDTDSDGNGIDDETEAGPNPTEPADADQDRTPDYLDDDDEGDGLLDVNEDDGYRTVALEPAETQSSDQNGTAILISSLLNDMLNIFDVARAGDSVTIAGINLPTDKSKTWIIIRGTEGVLNFHPDSITSEVINFSWPSGITTGLVDIFISYDNIYTNSLAVLVPDDSGPVLTGYSHDISTGEITFEGLNLNASLTIHFTGASISMFNGNGSATSFTVSVPNGARRGEAYVNSSAGDSNFLWVELTRYLTGTVELPSGSSVDVTSLDVSWSLDPEDEVNPDAGGAFTTTASISDTTIITALFEDTSAADPTYAAFLEAVVLKDDTDVTLNADSTALTLIWSALGVQGLVAESSLDSVRDILAGLQEITDLGSLLETKLAADPFALSQNDTEIQDKISLAIQAGATAVSDALSSGSLTPAGDSQTLRLPSSSTGGAIVTPPEVDDISVYERDQTGNLNLENDTQLFLSVQIEARGFKLHKHITNVRGMAGPQGYGMFFWASTTKFTEPRHINCTVQVITPGADMEYDPKMIGNYNVYKWLVGRTIVERIIWPPISSVISVKINPGDFASIVIGNLHNMGPIMDDFMQKKYKDGTIGLLNAVRSDFTSAPPGPIAKALAVRFGKDIAKEALAKLAAKIGAKFVPVLGQISLALDVAGHINNGVNAAKAVNDIANTDNVIEFDVRFDIKIDEVIPSLVKPDGKSKAFLIKGAGFSKAIRTGYIFDATLLPEITFTAADGSSVVLEPSFISEYGTSMWVIIPGSFLTEDAEGPLKVSIHHPTDKYDSEAYAEKDPAVLFTSEVTISSIVPDKGGAGTAATIYGAGFNSLVSYNEVMIGSTRALISYGSDTTLGIVIPNSLDPGIYDVKARSFFEADWTDWSNSVPFEVVEGEVKITVCDNGGLKDDAFALYVDGIYKGTVYASDYSYCSTYSMSLSAGDHTAMLLGIEAPDAIGTYSISFSGVENLAGDSTSGGDLVPGVKKYYTFSVSAEVSSSNYRIKARTYEPRIPDAEFFKELSEKK